MRLIHGYFCLLVKKIETPELFYLPLSNKILVKVLNSKTLFEFDLFSESENESYLWGIIRSCSLGLGLFLDSKIQHACSYPSVDISGNLPQINDIKEKVKFKIFYHKLEFDSENKIYKDSEECIERDIDYLKLIETIKKINMNKILSYSIENYLNIFEDSDYLLHLLYKSYESIENTGFKLKKRYEEIARLANDLTILDGRHSPKPSDKTRYLKIHEREKCQKLAKEMILEYADSIETKNLL